MKEFLKHTFDISKDDLLKNWLLYLALIFGSAWVGTAIGAYIFTYWS